MTAIERKLLSGALIAHFEVREVLGWGGFGITYKARDTLLERWVAIKEFLPFDLALRETGDTTIHARTDRIDDYRFALGKFLQEAQTLARFDHPNIVRVTQFLEANGTAYLVMNYEQGRALSNWLKDHPGPAPEETLRRWFVPILRGLTAVHDKGFLHRDIKPGNIYLRDAGEPLLIDFGAARQAISEHSRSVRTVSDGYAPPEQYLSDAAKQGAWTDLYALGATLYRCISGADPTDANTRQTALTNREADPLRPAQDVGKDRYSPGLLRLIDDLLQLPTKARPPSAEAALKRLAGADKPHGQKQYTGTRQVKQPTGTRELTEDEPKPTPEPDPTPKPKPKPKPKRPALRAAAGAVAALLLGLIAWQWLSPPAPDWFQEDPDEAAVVPATPADPAPPEVAVRTPGRLMLELEPADAQVMLPDIESPYRPGLELPAGEYRVVVRRAGYKEFADTLRIDAGQRTTRTIALVEKPGRLMLELEPADAQVSLPDSESPYRPGMELPAGEYRVVVRRAGYEEVAETVRIEAGRRTTRTIALIEKPGSLVLELEPADAQVILPDIGPRYRPGLELAAGSYRVVVRRAGYQPFDDTLRINAGQRTTRAIALVEKPGRLMLELEPADAQVMLPDTESPYRPGLELAAGEYRVVVRRAGYEEFAGTLRIEAGRRTTRAIALRRTEPERAVGEVFRDTLKSGGEGPAMVVLPTGRFRMGSKNNERGRDDNEGPVRTVTISRSIAMGRYGVTFAEYDRFARATGRDRPDDKGWGRSNRPVIYVSQKDAKAYAAWLSKETGKRYRLPSESEWEYAARAGTSTRYSWGNEIGRNRANCDGCGSAWDAEKTAPVGSFAANAFGLHDLHGNVREWVEDCWHENYRGAPSDGRAWTSGCDGGSRAVVRGGSWLLNPQSVRSAYRNWYTPSYRFFNVGFRLVQDLNP